MTRKDIETLLFDPVQSPQRAQPGEALSLGLRLLRPFYVLNVPPFMQ